MALRITLVKPSWRVCLVAGVCVATSLFCLLHRPEKRQPAPHPTPLPRGRFVRSASEDLDGRPPSGLGTQEPRVLCMVVTSPQHHRGRARHLKATWGHWGNYACPNTVFLTSAPDDVLQNVIISNFSRYEDLWGKVVDGFLRLNTSAADWFLKVDDDTFLIYPHLLKLLAPLDPSKALYLGLPLIYRPEGGDEVTYMSGGAGYVLSRAALARMQAPHSPARCRNPGYTRYEDVNMGYCMADLGVREADTRDSLGRPRFLPYPPWRFLQPKPHSDLNWLINFSKYKFHFVVVAAVVAMAAASPIGFSRKGVGLIGRSGIVTVDGRIIPFSREFMDDIVEIGESGIVTKSGKNHHLTLDLHRLKRDVTNGFTRPAIGSIGYSGAVLTDGSIIEFSPEFIEDILYFGESGIVTKSGKNVQLTPDLKRV